MNIYGVSFKDRGKVYYFNAHDLKVPINVTVIVETEKGLQFGKVINKVEDVTVEKFKENLKDILRISTKKDYEQYLTNLKDAKIALDKAKEFVKELNLAMRFFDAEFTFDRRQLVLNFYADERVDFRELAKRLAGVYRTRIELRQVGARDKAEEIGGLGPCGRELCCSSFLCHMESVSMNMAKNQNLALNPSKINGCCGRLLCCLTYEDEEYTRCHKNLPSFGERVKTEFGEGPVTNIDVLNQKYKVLINGENIEINVNDEKSIK